MNNTTIIVCPYCNNSINISSIFSLARNYIFDDNYIFNCDNHPNIVELYYNELRKEIYSRKLYGKDYHIFINNNMHIIYNYNVSNEFVVPLDNSLTPENIEQKIKTYLTFQ